MEPDLLTFRCSSGHVLSETKSVTPQFFYISDITSSSSFNGKIFRKKSMSENFRANVLKWKDLSPEKRQSTKNSQWGEGGGLSSSPEICPWIRAHDQFSLDYWSSLSFSQKSMGKNTKLVNVRASLQSWQASNDAANHYSSTGVGKRPLLVAARRSHVTLTVTLKRVLVLCQSSSTVFEEREIAPSLHTIKMLCLSAIL